MKQSEATNVVEGMIHAYCLCTNVVRGDICAQRADFSMTCAPKCAQNFECVHGTCPVLIDFIPYWPTCAYKNNHVRGIERGKTVIKINGATAYRVANY